MSDDYEIAALQVDFDELDSLLDVDSLDRTIPGLGLQATRKSLKPEVKVAMTKAQRHLQQARDSIKEALEGIRDAQDDARKNRLAVQALTTFGSLEANVNDVVATTGAVTTASSSTAPVGALGVFIGKLKSVLAKIQAGMLSFLAKYVNFQSWSIAGQLTGGVPWLSGSATLTLTFGP